MAKILLVEDNEANRDMLSRRLERKGYQRLDGNRRPPAESPPAQAEATGPHPHGHEPARD